MFVSMISLMQADFVSGMCDQRQQLVEKIFTLESALLRDETASHPDVPVQRYRTYGTCSHDNLCMYVSICARMYSGPELTRTNIAMPICNTCKHMHAHI